jgi:hypothetical protein
MKSALQLGFLILTSLSLGSCEASGPVGRFFGRDGGGSEDGEPCGTVPATWTCDPAQYCDGACDCGCTTPDPECMFPSVMGCDFDNCPEGLLPVAASPEACTADPCEETSTDGFCATDQHGALLLFCSVPTGSAQPTLYTYYCESWEDCDDARGPPRCVANQRVACRPGEQRCSDDGIDVLTCTADGSLLATPCAGCTISEGGAICHLGDTIPVEGSLKYTFRGIAPGYADWGDEVTSAARFMLVLSLRADDTIVDSARTDENGRFAIRVPSRPSDGDRVTFYALLGEPGEPPVLAVAAPDVGDGVNEPLVAQDAQADAFVHGTSIPSQRLLSSPRTTWTLSAEESGWARAFDFGRYVYRALVHATGQPGKSLVIWMRPNSTWTCGACYARWPASMGPYRFESQIMLPMTARDQGYWSSSVIAHELGHWYMDSYGRATMEAGPHRLGTRTFPGQAWSEGFATWMSSLIRGDQTYVDKQDGTMFWFDLGRSCYGRGSECGAGFPAAVRDDENGVLQLMEENTVAAMLWRLSAATRRTFDDPPSLDNASALFRDALSAPRMTVPPFERGYVRHTWTVTDHWQFTDVEAWPGDSEVTLADYLDSVVCLGLPGNVVSDAVGNFPYRPETAICR